MRIEHKESEDRVMVASDVPSGELFQYFNEIRLMTAGANTDSYRETVVCKTGEVHLLYKEEEVKVVIGKLVIEK